MISFNPVTLDGCFAGMKSGRRKIKTCHLFSAAATEAQAWRKENKEFDRKNRIVPERQALYTIFRSTIY